MILEDNLELELMTRVVIARRALKEPKAIGERPEDYRARFPLMRLALEQATAALVEHLLATATKFDGPMFGEEGQSGILCFTDFAPESPARRGTFAVEADKATPQAIAEARAEQRVKFAAAKERRAA